MSYERTTVRLARKERPCTGFRCRRTIRPGEVYNEHVTGPGHELLGNTRWMRQAECTECAEWRTGQPVTRAPQ